MATRRDSCFFWDGLKLRRQSDRSLRATVVCDAKYQNMFRFFLPGGQLSDMVNLTRAKDAAEIMAARALTDIPQGAREGRGFAENSAGYIQ